MGDRRRQRWRAACLRGISIAALAAAAGVAGCGGFIRHDELRRGVKTLGAVAAEGQLLAQDVARDRTRSTFTRVQARELAAEVDHEAEKLHDAGAEGPLVRRKAEAVQLAKDISSALGDLAVAPGDEPTGRHVATRLRHYANDADDLAGAL